MGRIKLLMVKRTANQLMNCCDEFSDNFEKDKKILGSTMPSKSIRNKVAGYIARLKKPKKVKQPKLDVETE